VSHGDYTAEIQANLQRAEKAIEAAEKLLSDGYFDFVASRAYYAAFYAATALLLKEGLEFRKHSGVIASIHKHFIKTGKLEKQFGKDLNWLFEIRNVGDYGVTIHVPKKEAENALNAARRFIGQIRILIDGAKNEKRTPTQ